MPNRPDSAFRLGTDSATGTLCLYPHAAQRTNLFNWRRSSPHLAMAVQFWPDLLAAALSATLFALYRRQKACCCYVADGHAMGHTSPWPHHAGQIFVSVHLYFSAFYTAWPHMYKRNPIIRNQPDTELCPADCILFNSLFQCVQRASSFPTAPSAAYRTPPE